MHARGHWALLFAACWPALCPAALDPTDVFQVQANVSIIRDNNLFRLPDVDPRLFGIDPANKEDTTFVKGIGIKLDKTVSRQRFLADVSVNESTYDKNDNLDFVGGDGRATWFWQVGNYWSGEATYRKRRALGGFSDFRQNVQDLIDTDTYSVSAGYLFHPRWRISVDAGEQEATHSAAERRDLDYRAHTIGTELRYTTPAQNYIGLQARRIDRNYPNRVALTLDNGHRELRVNANASWQVSGLVRIDGQVGHVEVEHDNFPQRDFSGATWRAAASWEATGKLRLNFNTLRDVRLYEDVRNSYIVVSSVGFSPVYALAPKVLLQADFNYEKRDFRGALRFDATDLEREDTNRLARIGVVYTPIRNVDLSLSYEIGSRRANTRALIISDGALKSVKINDYDYQTWFATVRVGF